jgi:hypothetical protein
LFNPRPHEHISECEELKNDPSCHENYMFKMTESGVIKKIWFRLIDKDLLYFKSPHSFNVEGLHNLSKTFITEESPIISNGIILYCVGINFHKKVRKYYLSSLNTYREWLAILRKNTNNENILKDYDIGEKIGRGKFGVVREALHRTTKMKCAIKIINKQLLREADLMLIYNEIEILKVSQHPNIIRLYDVYENVHNIYISKQKN